MTKEVFDLLAKLSKKDKGRKKSMVVVGMVSYICAECQVSVQTIFNHDSNTQEVNSTRKVASTNTPTPTQSVPDTVCSQLPHSSTTQTLPTAVSAPVLGVEGPTKVAEDHRQHTHKAICYRYKQGRCPHGKSGNKIVLGKTCNYLHPQKCLKHCRFGQDKDQGCNGPCELFHPILCRNSLRYKTCYKQNCTFAHLSGTERYEKQTFPAIQNSRSFYNQHDANFQNRHQLEPRMLGPQQSFKYSSHVRPDFQRNDNQGFQYQSSDFPPLSQSQDHRMNEMSCAIKQLQKCLDYLVQHSSTNQQLQHLSNNINRQGNVQPSQIYHNSHQPHYNNQHQANFNIPQQMPSSSMLNVPQQPQAKNC